MRDGVLSSLFADLVNQFATQIAAQEVVDTVTALQATPWFSLSLVVSNRFVDALGADLNSPATMSFLAQSFGVVDGNVRSPFVSLIFLFQQNMQMSGAHRMVFAVVVPQVPSLRHVHLDILRVPFIIRGDFGDCDCQAHGYRFSARIPDFVFDACGTI